MSEITLFLANLEFNWSIIETTAVLFSIIYVVLATKQNIWCWVFAAISVTLYIYICLNARLFAETGLQAFYLFMAAYGYYNWNKSDTKLEVQQWSPTKHLLLILFGAISTFLIGFYFTAYTNAKMPIVDSFTTVFSIIATYMIAKKVLENWLYWIVIDVVSIYLYFSRDLHLTSLLFMLYSIIAIFGYFSWLKKMKVDV
jgi:nicotinamide mononucleotide transporter